MVAALFAKAFELLATPTGAISLVAALLAGGVAVREWRGRRNGNGHGLEQADHPGERTAEGRKDLKVLQQPDAEEVAIVRAAVEALELRVTGPGGIQERVAIVETTCTRIETKVDELPRLFGAMVDALDAKLAQSQDKAFRDMGVSLSKALVRLVRGSGGPLDRRSGPTIPLPAHRERRREPGGES